MDIENEIYIGRDFTMGLLELRIVDKKRKSVAKPLEFEVLEDGMWSPPCFSFHTNIGQQIMDQLWICGLRPSEGTGSAGSLKATQDHLEDMRKLAFHKIIKS